MYDNDKLVSSTSTGEVFIHNLKVSQSHLILSLIVCHIYMITELPCEALHDSEGYLFLESSPQFRLKTFLSAYFKTGRRQICIYGVRLSAIDNSMGVAAHTEIIYSSSIQPWESWEIY